MDHPSRKTCLLDWSHIHGPFTHPDVRSKTWEEWMGKSRLLAVVPGDRVLPKPGSSAQEGAKVVIGDVLDAEGTSLAAEIAEAGGDSLFVH